MIKKKLKNQSSRIRNLWELQKDDYLNKYMYQPDIKYLVELKSVSACVKCRIMFHFFQYLSLDWMQYLYFCPPVSNILFQSHMKQIMIFLLD